MKIATGLFDTMTLQRDAKGFSQQPFSGSCKASGLIRASVFKGGKALKKLKAVPVGKAEKGLFMGFLSGIPVGGPYEVELSIVSPAGKPVESLTIGDVMVGDVWILAGQSNMEGIGDLKHALKPSKRVRAYYMHDRWALAKEPLHVLAKAAAPVHKLIGVGCRHPSKGVGPGLAFGLEMLKAAGVPQGLIACGHGGTSMAQWDPALKAKGSESLYGAMMERVERNGGRAAGVVWFQGCSDANPEAAAIYMRKMAAFVKALRRDLKDPALPFATVQISRLASGDGDRKSWMAIRDLQRLLPSKIKGLATVPAIDLELDDLIHIGGQGQNRLGVRLAQAMLTLLKAPKSLPPPIELESFKTEPDPRFPACSKVVVSFRNVVGSLRSAGRPSGFALSCGLRERGGVFRIDLSGSKAILNSSIGQGELKSLQLSYGFGLDPYCNIVDEAGRSLPAFGPLQIGKSIPMTPFAERFSVSSPVFVEETMESLVHPSKRQGLSFKPCVSSGFYAVPEDRAQFSGPEPKIRYFKTSFDCPVAQRARLLFGYDGPVKLYCDGVEVFRDPNGVNPIIPDHKSLDLDWKPGNHELVFALAINEGRAWGVSLRIALPGFKSVKGSLVQPPLPKEL